MSLLPPDNMYSLQLGDALFRVSGFSLNSDAPSYFTRYFAENPSTPLFLDRSPDVFRLILHHLQGYALDIQDESQYTALFCDALYFRLPRLQSLLQSSEYHYTCVGGIHFKLPKLLVSEPGNHPNYFDVTNAAIFSELSTVFNSGKFLRPPPVSPPYVNRSPQYFSDLVAVLQGAVLDLSPCKRRSLIHECRYYRFLRLEQQLLPCHLSWNPVTRVREIQLQLEDLKPSGLVLPTRPKPEVHEPLQKKPRLTAKESHPELLPLQYQRPFLDQESNTTRDLIFQLASPQEATLYISENDAPNAYLALSADVMHKFCSVFNKILLSAAIDLKTYTHDEFSHKMLVLPTRLDYCHILLDSHDYPDASTLLQEHDKLEEIPDFDSFSHQFKSGRALYLTKSLWKLCLQDEKLMLSGFKINALSCSAAHSRNHEYL